MTSPTDHSPWLLPAPELRWDEQGSPHSSRFDDIYFSRAGGSAETEYVFLQQNDLQRRWQALDPQRPGLFVIGETGFGTGLNFLAASALWRRCAPPGWRLLFLSAERFPLSRAELEQALAQWPQYAALSARLVAAYPPRLPGSHRREIDDSIALQLLFGDAAEQFHALADSAAPALPAGTQVDCWFLDGFAPAKNPEMWSAPLFAALARLSRPWATTFATFTAAGFVRRGLQAAGFTVERVAGFGAKREMLRGQFVAPLQSAEIATPAAIDYWATPPAPPSTADRCAVVVGAGLAGSHTARALALRGWQVTVLERADRIAAAASGNPQGVLYTRLSTQASTLARFALASFQHALAHYRARLASGDLAGAGDLCGVLQLADEDEWQKLRLTFGDTAHGEWLRFVDTAAASTLAGCAVPRPALWFPSAGWLAPALLCQRNLDHPRIEVRLDCAVKTLQRDGDHWRLDTSNGELAADCVILCSAHDTSALLGDAALPTKPIRGQITRLPATLLAQTPRCVICHDGYLAPDSEGATIGATFDLRDDDPSVRPDDHRRNLQQQADALPALLVNPPAAIDCGALQGRTAFRTATPDYLPIAGAVADVAALRVRFGALADNARKVIAAEPAWLLGLYVNIGHGSRGLTSTPLCAELLASLICGEPRPLPRDLQQALSPARFAIRDLIRGR
jgi:tRNA 5-methylaminomethyl-2-thiouridine biosynthesis bifunctional protein